jgi:hypothetical protein
MVSQKWLCEELIHRHPKPCRLDLIEIGKEGRAREISSRVINMSHFDYSRSEKSKYCGGKICPGDFAGKVCPFGTNIS